MRPQQPPLSPGLPTGTVQTVKGFGSEVQYAATTPSGGLFVSGYGPYVWTILPGPLVPQRLIDLRRPAEALAVGAGSLWIASPDPERGGGDDLVVRYDENSARLAERVRVGATPLFITFAFGRLWVSNYDGDSVSVVTPGRKRAQTIPIGDGPLGIAEGEGSIWVVHYGDRELWRIDPVSNRRLARIPVGAGPLSVAVGAGSVWVTVRDVMPG